MTSIVPPSSGLSSLFQDRKEIHVVTFLCASDKIQLLLSGNERVDSSQ